MINIEDSSYQSLDPKTELFSLSPLLLFGVRTPLKRNKAIILRI